MDASDRPSPRSRQLQGPRPPRLAVSKDSHKVRKPPVVPQPRGGGAAGQSRQPQQQQQPRAPVIIYDASPKVIHTRPSEFMALVQRLTGPGSTAAAPVGAGFDAEASSASAALPPQFQLPQEFMLSPTAALSPAARYAAIERSVRPLPPTVPSSSHYYAADDPILLDVDGDAAFTAALGPARPGILSPVPSALPPAASSGLFSPLDQASLSWLSDLSPFLHSAGAAPPPPPPFAPSPRSLLLSTPTMPSPATFSVMEFFRSNFPDL